MCLQASVHLKASRGTPDSNKKSFQKWAFAGRAFSSESGTNTGTEGKATEAFDVAEGVPTGPYGIPREIYVRAMKRVLLEEKNRANFTIKRIENDLAERKKKNSVTQDVTEAVESLIANLKATLAHDDSDKIRDANRVLSNVYLFRVL